jgi:lipoprotein-anchoring transpeptidase ErfK/SrfK
VTSLTDTAFGATNAATADLDGDGTQELIVSDGKPAFSEEKDEKSIVVDLSEQRLYAYENGILENSFLVSTGIHGLETEIGHFHVLAKLPYVYYSGPGWDLGNVPWNLRIYEHHYIHYAYWHNNFGHPMSHGCVNVNLENIKWIYNWANVGTPVDIHS